MSHEFIFAALAIISALTSLTVEAVKKILNERGVKYSANLLAMIVAIVLTSAICVSYVLYHEIPFTVQTVIIMIAMVYLSFLSATLGFDKIKQLREQIGC